MVDLEDSAEVGSEMDSGEDESFEDSDSGDGVVGEESDENEGDSGEEVESDENDADAGDGVDGEESDVIEDDSGEEEESDENDLDSGEEVEESGEGEDEVNSGEEESVDNEMNSGEEESGEDEGKTEEEDSSDEKEEISGWADSMLNILKSTKPKNKKNLILSRARKDYEINKNATAKPQTKGVLEIARDGKSSETDVKTEEEADVGKETEDSHILSLKKQRKLELRQRKLERAWENLNRLTNEQPDKELETDLVKVATKGVVQLFNAVATQQKTVRTKLRASRKSEFKKEKVLSQSKDYFESAMNKSKGQDNDDSDGDDDEVDEDVEIKEESSSDEDVQVKPEKSKLKRKLSSGGDKEISSKRPVWQALQDDFMLSAKLKDWDKESDSD